VKGVLRLRELGFGFCGASREEERERELLVSRLACLCRSARLVSGERIRSGPRSALPAQHCDSLIGRKLSAHRKEGAGGGGWHSLHNIRPLGLRITMEERAHNSRQPIRRVKPNLALMVRANFARGQIGARSKEEERSWPVSSRVLAGSVGGRELQMSRARALAGVARTWPPLLLLLADDTVSIGFTFLKWKTRELWALSAGQPEREREAEVGTDKRKSGEAEELA